MADPPAPAPTPAAGAPPEGAVRIQNEAGEAYYVTPDVAAAALRAGGWGMLRGDKLPMVNTQSGKPELVDAADAVERLGSEASEVTSVGRANDQFMRDQYDASPAHKALAFGTGAVKSLGLGFGDAGLVGAASMFGRGEHVRGLIQDQERYLGGYRTGGEAAGFLLPALATGGGYGALRGLTAGGRAVAAGGAALEGAVARGLVRAGAAEGGVLARGLSSAAGQALEMGVYGAGEATSRAVVQNPGLTGEQAAAALGGGFLHGAAFGAAGGALLGGGGALLRSAASKGAEGVTALAERLTGRVAGEGSALGRLAETVMPGGLEKYAERKALQATGANEKLLSKIEDMSAEVQSIAARQYHELGTMVGKREGAILSHTEQAEAAGILKNQIGKTKGALVDELEAAGVKADVAGITAALRTKLDPMRKSVVSEVISAAKEADLTINRLEANFASGSVKDLWKEQRALGDSINWDRIRSKTGTAEDKALADIYFALGNEFEKVGLTNPALGVAFKDKWKQVNREYTAADWLTKATEKGRGKDLGNRAIGFSELVGGGAMANVGATIGSVAGPIGAAIGGLAGGVGGVIVNRLVKQYGDQAVATALKQVVNKGGGDLTMVAGQLLEQSMGKGVVAFLKGGAEKAGAVAGRAYKGAELAASEADARKAAKEPLEKRYTQTVNNVLAARTSAPQRQAQVAQAAAGARPDVTASMLATTTRAADYLASKVPPTPQSQNTLQPHLDKSTPPTAEMAKFLRAVAVVEDPTTVFKSLQRGDLTAEEVDALRNVYPEMYGQLQGMILTEASKLEKPVGFAKAQSLNALFPGVVLHPALAPEFIAAQQAALTAPPAGVQPPARKPMKPSNLSKDYALDTQEA
jgi:hypothetical protein